MKMIQLKNVSKYYYSKGMIASGISRINLDFDIGEFVVITGESGSGKTTLLNVISGLDTYEEGEMYVEGKETSHYQAAEFEEYRKKYIGNIFQNYNLISSYTVYQNIELILWINGVAEDEIRKRVPEIIKKVGLSEYTRTKVSKLSGGQKQRVSIARALAKDTSIIIADEPTGNLDSGSAEDIIRLLAEIARDKLVVIVTHNFEQFEAYATRIIRMNDGRVIEDKAGERNVSSTAARPIKSGKLSTGNKIRLGVRNAFNIAPKFLLMLIVFLFVTLSVCGVYTSYKETQNAAAEYGWNAFFPNYSDDRIVVKRSDNKAISDEEIVKLQDIDGVDEVVKDDILLDRSVSGENEYFSYYGYIYPLKSFKGNVIAGGLPENTNEAVLRTGEQDGALMVDADEAIGKKCELIDEQTGMVLATFTICGVQFMTEEESWQEDNKLYVSEEGMRKLCANSYYAKSTVKIKSGTRTISCGADAYEGYVLKTSKKVPKGKLIVPEEFNENYSNGKASGQNATITCENMYFSENCKLKIDSVFIEKTYKKKIGGGNYEDHIGSIFMNPEDYDALFNKGTYQVSIFTGNSHAVDKVSATLEKQGLKTLALKDAISKGILDEAGDITSVVQVPLLALLVIGIFFIAFFVVRLILKSRDVYFSIVRMLGMAKKDIRRIMDIEMITVVTIAYAIFIVLLSLVNRGIIDSEYLSNLIDYMSIKGYVLLYLILALMSYLISGRFTRKLFATSAMQAYRGEA